MEKPSNSKVIKNFVPKLRRRKCSSCLGIPVLYIYIHIYISIYIYIYIYVLDIMNVLHYERYEYVYFTYSYLAMYQQFPNLKG